MRIFISHATEDKADFVKPLADALKEFIEVWYDEYELTVGDSLFQKVNEGLASCDYGVVVLSSSFFNKKWTRAELDGLFALEGTTRKMILPVWKDVSVEEVRQFSPVLAGRLGAKASDGVKRVVEELRRAIEVSNRTKEISAPDSAMKRAKLVDQNLHEKRNHDELSRSEEGVALVSAGYKELCDIMKATFQELNSTSKVLRFTSQQSVLPIAGSPLFIINANYGLSLHVLIMGLGSNYTYEAELLATMFRTKIERFGIPHKADTVRQLKFKPAFRLQNQLSWTKNDRDEYSTKELADLLLETIVSEIQRQSKMTRI